MDNSKIVYKWVIKAGDNYFPLVNYGIDKGKCMNEPPYKLNKIYSNYKNIFQNHFNNNSRLDSMPGYHCFVEPYPNTYNGHKYENLLTRWEDCMSKVSKRNIKITILECEIEPQDILIERENRLIVSKLKVIRERTL